MRVFGKLSFRILIITCSTLFVNKQVQAFDGQDTNSKAGVHRIGTTPINEGDTSVEEDTTNEEAEEYFDCLVRPRPPRITKIDFVQKLDHFDHFDDRTWIQRAYLDSQYERDDGPVLLKLGAFKEIFPHELEDPTMVVLAKRYHAAMYILEHRYHGASVPTDLSADHLEYTRSEQVLADIDYFIKKSKRDTRKWVVFGLGYAGSLAAWFRLKYPHAASGALASISPVFSMTEIKDGYQVFENFTESQLTTLNGAFNELRAAVKNNQFKELKEKFNMCTQLDEGSNRNDDENFMYWSILSYLSEIIFTDDIKVKKLLSRKPSESPLNRLATVVKTMNGKKCFSVNLDDAIQKYKNLNIKYQHEIDYPVALRYGLKSRPGFYKRCTEYGLFETSDGEYTFGVKVHLDFYIKTCGRVFDRKFDLEIYREAMDTTNMIYGGHDIAATNFIYFTPEDEISNSVGIYKSKFNEIVVVNNEDKNGEDYLKVQYDLIIDKLNEWTRKKSEGVDNSVVGATVKVGETVVSQSAAVEEETKTAT